MLQLPFFFKSNVKDRPSYEANIHVLLSATDMYIQVNYLHRTL